MSGCLISREEVELCFEGVEFLIEDDAAVELLLTVHFGAKQGDLALPQLMLIAALDEDRQGFRLASSEREERLKDGGVESSEVESDGERLEGAGFPGSEVRGETGTNDPL